MPTRPIIITVTATATCTASTAATISLNSLLPLLGGGYMPGQMFPTSYMNSYVPSYYQPFYPDTSNNYYRYANGNVYGIDPYTGMIDNVIPMYANGYGYGQMLPASYSAYNVPYQYRAMYYDTADYYYRYAPGAIYQVDPGTSLITGGRIIADRQRAQRRPAAADGLRRVQCAARLSRPIL